MALLHERIRTGMVSFGDALIPRVLEQLGVQIMT
jgi:hypothetical protein